MQEIQPHTTNALDPEQTSTSESTKEKRFPVIEIFGPVIQGEGSQAGQQTMFIRFGGCDFRCTMCDSMHAVEPKAVQKHRTMMTTAEISDRLQDAVLNTGVRWVTFSGGNPAMHDLTELVEELKFLNFLINVETQGTLFPAWLNLCDVITVSPKSIGMGEKFEAEKFGKWVTKVERPLCVKVVVFSAQDLELALWVEQITRDALRQSGQSECLVVFYFSLGNPYPPVLNEEFDLIENPALIEMSKSSGLSPKKAQIIGLLGFYRDMSEVVLLDRRLKSWKFLPQLHVLVYGNESER